MKKTKRASVVLVLLLLLFGMYAGATVAPPDEMSDWAREEIAAAIERGIVPEELQGSYGQEITRQEFCLLAINYLSVRKDTPYFLLTEPKLVEIVVHPFRDTSDPYVETAYKLEIVNGRAEGVFDPEGLITRQEAAAMLMRTQKAYGLETGGAAPHSFADGDKIADWAVSAVAYVSENGIMNGTGAGMFDPAGFYTREQAIVTFCRMLSAA